MIDPVGELPRSTGEGCAIMIPSAFVAAPVMRRRTNARRSIAFE